MSRNPLEAQEIYFSRGAEVPIEVTVYASQYPNASVVQYRFQIFSDASPTLVYVNKTGSGTVASLKFTVLLSVSDTTGTPATTDLDPDYHHWLMWDTDLDREIAFGYAFVKEGIRS